MSTITLAMIVKNEEAVLDRCLLSVKDLVDEIIIVDTGSVDKTKEIAGKYTDKIFDFEWVDDFSRARNFAFSLATKDYIMWLDADDVLDKVYEKDFLKLKENLDNYDVVMMRYNVAFNKNGKATFSYFRERIMKRSENFIWNDAVHETITPRGRIYHSEIAVSHLPKNKERAKDRNLKIYERELSGGVKFSARQQFYYSRELMYNGHYENAILNFHKFLEMKGAWKENLISACRDMSKCYRQLGDLKEAKCSLLKSLLYDRPRAEICCGLGELFFNEKNYEQAIFWYEHALKCEINLQSGAFVETEYYDLIPYLQLCICYYSLGKAEKAEYYNDLAGLVDSKNESYLYNKKFFDNLKNNKS